MHVSIEEMHVTIEKTIIIIFLFPFSVGQAEIAEATGTMGSRSRGRVRGLPGQCGKQKDVRGLEATGVAIEYRIKCRLQWSLIEYNMASANKELHYSINFYLFTANFVCF